MRHVGSVLAAILVLVTVTPTAAGAAVDVLGQESVDPNVIVMDAEILENGDAAWTVDYRVRLDDDNDTRAFEAVQADIRENESAYTGRFRDRMNRTARDGENATGREMRIDNVSVETGQQSFGQSYGVVSYRFRWANFATVNETQIEAGDALSGLFLDSDTSLTLRWPDGYETETVRPAADEDERSAVTWTGQQSFGGDEPRLVLRQSDGAMGDDVGIVPEIGPVVLAFLGGVLAVLLLAAGVAYWIYRDVFADDGDDDPDGEAAGADSADGEDVAPTSELLSNEEQVLALLRSEGGRVKQQQVASDLDWTAAKTSQVISGLREDDAVETFRIGRENVVTLPGTDLTDGSEDTT